MEKLKVFAVVGTRPEAIKMAPVIQYLKYQDELTGELCATGQHDEMLRQVLELFDIVPDYNLNVMHPNQTVSSICASVIQKLDPILKNAKPDIVLVHGDTATTLGGALCAYFNHIKVGHVEAGLRTGDLYAPWPEEGNRRLVSQITQLHFAPTSMALDNLRADNIDEANVYITGNTVIDALFLMTKKIQSCQHIRSELAYKFRKIDFSKKVLLVTCHRRENLEFGIRNICRAILELVNNRNDVEIVLPMHLNPNVREVIKMHLGASLSIHLIEPLDYHEFIYMMEKSYIIMTDSGGVQEEAPSLGKPVLVLRDVTERPEGVKAGTLKLVGTNVDAILYAANELLNDQVEYSKMANKSNPYGDGNAAKIISERIKEIKQKDE